MNKNLFFIFNIVFLLLANFSWAENSNFDNITAGLKAKKNELEPFDQKKVKVDLESLGLDVDDDKAKDTAVTTGANTPATATSTVTLDTNKTESVKTTNQVVSTTQSHPTEAPQDKVDIGKGNNLFAIGKTNSTRTLANANPDVKAKTNTPTTSVVKTEPNKTQLVKTIISDSRTRLKKRLIAEKAHRKQTENEKLQSKKLSELDELRKKYLAEMDQNNRQLDNTLDVIDSTFADAPIIIPRRKEIGKFDSKEPPPPPILNNFRTSENIHIPLIPSSEQKIQSLFDTVITNDPALFDEAFKTVNNVNVMNKFGDTILTFATLLRKHAIVAAILTKGADPNMPNKLGYTPLSIAIELADSKSFELLFNNKADLNYVDAYGRTYLIQASRVGFLSGVESLVKNGADVNAMDSDGFTALSAAYRYKKEVVVKFLLGNGAETWVEKPYNPDAQSIMFELKNRWK